MNKKILCILVLCVALVFLVGCEVESTTTAGTQSTTTNQQGQQQNTGSTSQSGNGEAVFAVTDAAADMGAVSEVDMTIDNVQVYSQTQGWVTVQSEPQTFALLELKEQGKKELLAKTQLAADSYSKMRFDVTSVIVTDTNGTHEATVPKERFEFDGALDVKSDTTAAATFDVLADQSLHTTSEGEYVMGPVVAVETKSDAQVQTQGDAVIILGGTTTTSSTFGMDIDGNVGVGVKINANAVLDLGVSGTISAVTQGSIGIN